MPKFIIEADVWETNWETNVELRNRTIEAETKEEAISKFLEEAYEDGKYDNVEILEVIEEGESNGTSDNQ